MVKHTSLCGLGQSAPNPVLSTLRYFRHEYEALLKPALAGRRTVRLTAAAAAQRDGSGLAVPSREGG